MSPSKKKKRKAPKLRAWGKPTRKVMTMVIPSKREKRRARRVLKKQLRNELAKLERLMQDSE